jgi:hypothetical protein
MNQASVSISEAIDSNVGRKAYKVQVKGADGSPLAGAEVLVTLDGDGSLAAQHSTKEIRRNADASGSTIIEWHRRAIFLRGVKAELHVASPDEGTSISLEEVAPEVSHTSYDLPGKHKEFLSKRG